jgi:hypothetical protein
MAWIKVHQSIATNRKILQAADRLRIPEPQMIGHMTLLWLWSIENTQAGVLPVSEEMIRKVAGYPKAGRSFVEALVECELLERHGASGYRVVNFDEHIAPIIAATDHNRRRQQEFRNRRAIGQLTISSQS